MPVVNGVYLKDFAALPGAVADANIIPIAISGNQIAYRTTVSGIVTDARVTSKLLTGLSLTGGAISATDSILTAFGKVQSQVNDRVPYTGASGNVNLGTFDLTADIVNLNQLKAVGSGGLNIYSNSGTHIALLGGGGGAGSTFYGGIVGTSATFSGIVTTTPDAVINGVNIGKGGGGSASNTRVGLNALAGNTSGLNNTATGYKALELNTTGNSNCAVGGNSLEDNTTGGNNTATGDTALASNTTGNNNSAVGYNSLVSNTTGSNNVAFGTYAGRSFSTTGILTLADNSVFLGYNTRANANNETNQIVIGYDVLGKGSNTVTIGNSSITDNYFTGNIRGGAFIPTSASVPTNGMYLSAANTLDFATGSVNRLSMSSAGATFAVALSGTSYNFTSTGVVQAGLTVGANTYQNYAAIFAGGSTTVGSAQYAIITDAGMNGTSNTAIFANAKIRASATATTAYGLYVSNPEMGAAATLTNNYGLYIANQTSGGTLNYSIYSVGGLNYFGGATTLAAALSGTSATFSSSITTGAPSGGTAKPFKIGNVATVTPTSQNRTIEIEIDGTTYYLTAKTTND